MKTNHALCLLLLSVACGNPHLTKIDGVGSQFVPVIATPEVLENGPSLVAKDGLNLKTTNPSLIAPVSLQNLDIEQGWKVEYKLQKGEHFRILGGSCSAIIQAAESCDLNIEFFSSSPDIYLDNLIITYFKEGNPSETKEIKVPLRGERLANTVVKKGNIQIQSSSNKEEQDFGKSLTKETPSGKAIVKNIGEADVKLSLQVEKDENFSIASHNCPEIIKPQEECQVDIVFDANKPGIYQDKLIATYTSLDGKDEKVTKFPLMGEKDAPSETGPSQPVRGPLVASQVLSNNIDFGKIAVGTPVTKQVEIQNLGSLSYSLKDLKISNDTFVFSGSKYPGLGGTCGDIILPGSCLVEITYTPKAPGTDKGSFSLLTKEGDSVSLDLTGAGDETKVCEKTNEYLIVPEKSYPASQVIFPYLKSHSSTTAKLANLYGTEVNGYIKALNTYVVKDGMVYVTFKLPKMEGEISNLNFAVDVRKVIQDNYKDTEALCLSTKSVRRCSGHEFSLASWQKLKNPNFWDLRDTPVNERYEEHFSKNEKKCGAYNCMNLKTQYHLSRIFELNKDELEVIRKDGIINLILTDDTRLLSMPRMTVKTKVKADCGL